MNASFNCGMVLREGLVVCPLHAAGAGGDKKREQNEY
jgi:hypothetical protein